MRIRIRINGIVQGVGFRPFVYRIASENELAGFVRNDGKGVEIEVEGELDAVSVFVEKLRSDIPPLARIDSFRSEEIPAKKEYTFHIVDSCSEGTKGTAVSPDMTICDACLQEMRDPKNRRYCYPFINCTDCGPRYTIISTVPYDRPNTSMANFSMCERCDSEYKDPRGRRYHAQPISCFDCGPSLRLWMRDRDSQRENIDTVKETAKLLKEGRIVAVKGLGGFHLMCDASNDEAVRSLRERKHRPSKPFALMVGNLEMARALAKISEAEERLLLSRERPIVLLKKSDEIFSAGLSDSIAPYIDRIGLMLPYTPLHFLIFDHIDAPLVATSANLSDEPIIRSSDELREKLGSVVDAILDHDRDIVNACDDSVVQLTGDRVQWLRLARGAAPMTITLPFRTERKILATGANQKNTISLAFDDKIILSPHIGDLESIEAMSYFERTVETFKRFYDFDPDMIVHDMHPGYRTTRWAYRSKETAGRLETEKVQHHYAHALATMAEHGITEQVLAFVWDGTGYGSDGTVWGGEVIKADATGFERIAHLRPFRLLGASKAIREPRRISLSMLFEIYPLEDVLEMKNPAVEAFSSSEIKLLHQAWRREINSPASTSIGRLFDAVASLSGISQRVSYEGESGLLLEAAASNTDTEISFRMLEVINSSSGCAVIDWEPMLRYIVENGSGSLPAVFISSLVDIIEIIVKAHPGLPVLLGGGVFQNRTLMEECLRRSWCDRLLLPKRIPPNDASISLGQVWYALHKGTEEHF